MRHTPPKVPRPTRPPVAVSPTLGVEPAAADATALWRRAPAMPYVEPADDPASAIVTFLWDDPDAEDVLLFVNRITDETHLADSLMRRVSGTTLWTLSYRVSRGWRASYGFVVRRAGERAPWVAEDDQVAIRTALDRALPDPRNGDTCLNRGGVAHSVVALDAAPAQRWLARRPGVDRGMCETVDGPDGRTVWVHRTPGCAAGGPALVVLDGEVWTSSQDLPTTLDNLVAEGEIPPVTAFFVDSGGVDARWREMGGDGGAERWIVDALVPWMRRGYGVGQRPEDVVVIGQSLGALTALRVALARPDIVGGAVASSASLWQDDLADRVAALPSGGSPRGSPAIALEVGLQEWVLLGPHRRLAGALREAGVGLSYAEYDGGHDYACWRGGVADGLRAVLGGR
ncbi:DUF3327 domain-containing protein [Mumia sp. ZJ1417]|uniref:enterochelin esterase domain-containing protein n=1 Tax=Mumia sp. ZJ1417 TaxID=2708082 RepID=UPI00141F781B|nr:enterochelin esterase domain-containing protein [Mumia sp. ZJ1417]QMW66520.1 DUF3327 domain-containing protein [Mumia sp. ZJ1417]